MSLDDYPDFEDDLPKKRADPTKPPITQEELKALVEYDPQTGAFTLRQRVAHTRRWPGQSIALERDGKMVINLKQRQFVAARMAFLYMTGFIPRYVRHLNGIPRDLRWQNLAGYETIEKPEPHRAEVDKDAYTPRRVNCDHCSNSWIAQFDLSNSWIKCQFCQRVLRGEDLRKQIRSIQTFPPSGK